MELVFQIGAVQIFEQYSEMGEEIIQIADFEHFLTYYREAAIKEKKHLAFSLYYQEAAGSFSVNKIVLNPKYCNGHTFRYRADGWGVIGVFIEINKSEIECRITVNSKKRAQNWAVINMDMGDPILWNWKVVESKARKLIRFLRK